RRAQVAATTMVTTITLMAGHKTPPYDMPMVAECHRALDKGNPLEYPMAELERAVELVSSITAVRPRVGIVLGSGLGPVAEGIEGAVTIPYRQIPGFPSTTVGGHRGELVLGTLDGLEVAALMGRPHLYEGYVPTQLGFPIQLLGALGAEVLVVTNAAGGLTPNLEPGTLMLIEDHVNLPGIGGHNPLVGIGGGNERFVPMAGAYDEELRRVALEAAAERGIRAATGVYVMVAGPNYETAAEARFLRLLGADAVGMSTVPEVLVARWLGMRVVGISCITNSLLGPPSHAVDGHEGVLSVAATAAPGMAHLVRSIVRYLARM
ncbi:MAG TPA: purine-nucleoside phosphorylase, partial [Chloroflexota bacterium]|nr:purine-nucleoside phosphorylase [Chloroflexota bacterium]